MPGVPQRLKLQVGRRAIKRIQIASLEFGIYLSANEEQSIYKMILTQNAANEEADIDRVIGAKLT